MAGLDKLATMNPNAIGGAGGIGSQAPGAKAADKAAGAEFKQAFDQALGTQGTAAADPAKAARLGAISAQMGTAAPIKGAEIASSLKFSTHAVERMRSRGITFSPEAMKNIEGAVAKAAQKGSKDTLVLTDNSALIVSVKNNTVVTVMDKNAMKENVFTNIDSTVMV